jgi:hypothetical protein
MVTVTAAYYPCIYITNISTSGLQITLILFVKRTIYRYGYFITELGISKNKTLVTLLTKILVSTKKEG